MDASMQGIFNEFEWYDVGCWLVGWFVGCLSSGPHSFSFFYEASKINRYTSIKTFQWSWLDMSSFVRATVCVRLWARISLCLLLCMLYSHSLLYGLFPLIERLQQFYYCECNDVIKKLHVIERTTIKRFKQISCNFLLRIFVVVLFSNGHEMSWKKNTLTVSNRLVYFAPYFCFVFFFYVNVQTIQF